MKRLPLALLLGGGIAAMTSTAGDPSIAIHRQGHEVERIPLSAVRAGPGGWSPAAADRVERRRQRRDAFAAHRAATERLQDTLASVEGEFGPAARAALRSALAGWLAQAPAIRTVHRQTEETIRASGLDAEILARCLETGARFESGLDAVREAVERVLDGDPAGVAAALAALGPGTSAAALSPLGPGPDTAGALDPHAATTDPDAGMLPAGGDGGGVPGPDPAYLAETPEVRFTPEIAARAAALDNDPIRIFEFVRNEVANELYPGSRKGGPETLRQRAGNDTDQASLLISLLRAAGIPSRYVQASIEIPIDAFESWWASTDVDFVRAVISAEGMNGGGVFDGGGQITAVRKTHVYVEAYVPYGRYRGTGEGTEEAMWIRLDPSFTLHQVDDGADYVGDLGFDVDAFFASHISGFTPLTPLEAFETEIQAWLDANQPAATVADGLRTVEPMPQSLGLLPASMPYDIMVENARLAELSDLQRYKIRFQLYGSPGVLIDHTVPLSDIAGTPVTIDYVGATPADQSTIDSFGGIYNTPPNLVNLLARLKAGGTVLTTGTVSVGSARDLVLDLFFEEPNGGFNGEPQTTYPVIAGSANVFSFDPFRDVPGDADLAVTGPDALIESLLAATATGYQRLRNEGIDRLAPLVGASVQYDVRPNRALNAVYVAYQFDQPVDFAWQGLQVDIDERGRFNHDAVQRSGIRPNTFSELYGTLDGMQSSILENRVFEDLFSRDAVSTIKILQLASDQGIPICTITSSVGAECPGFSQAPEVLAQVNSLLTAGRTVTIPRDPITVDDWSGTGFSGTSGGGGAYLIAGALSPPINGGATVDSWNEDFEFVNCATQQILSADITVPLLDAPDEGALFPADDNPITFRVTLVATCDDQTNQTQTFEFQSTQTARELGTGVFEIEVLGATRTFAILDGDLKVDSDNSGRIDFEDEAIEAAQPFVFWVNDDDNSSANANEHRVFSPDDTPTLTVDQWNSFDTEINGVFDLMDLAPLGIFVDAGMLEAMTNLGVQVELRSERIQYFHSSREATGDGWITSVLSYWFWEDLALTQSEQPLYDDGGTDGDLLLAPETFDGTNTSWLVFEGIDFTLPEADSIQLVAYGFDPGQAVVLDEVKVKLMHTKDMYRSVSVRGAQTPTIYETERLEDGGVIRNVSVNQYPTTPVTDFGEYLWDDQHVLIFVHGFNNTVRDAEVGFQNVFRKLYLSGYRGDFVTFKWEGNETPGSLPAGLYFDYDVENAFESSKGLMNLIQEIHGEGKTVDIAAHSLGNLVMLDALRRLALTNPGTAYIRNIIHIEPAVWNGIYLGRPLPDGADYTDREVEQRATWDHWAADVPSHVAGIIINSYNPWDDALGLMVINDETGLNFLLRERGPIPGSDDTFTEWALGRPFRTPERLAYNIPRNPEFPTLPDPFRRWRDPMGTEPIPVTDFLQKNFNGRDYRWDLTSHSGYRTDPLWKMGRWYREVMVEHLGDAF